METADREKRESEVVDRQYDQIDGSHLTALILLAVSVAAAPWVALELGLTAFVVAHSIAVAVWLFLIIFPRRYRFALVLAIALALRLLVIAVPPALSGDVFRYLWDGTLFAHGIDPYEVAPDDPRLQHLREPWHSRINHPEVRTIYPPLAELLFLVIHRLTLWRLLILGCDLAILWLVRDRNDVVLALATCPLLIFEGVWSGHIEVIAALLLLIAYRRDSGLAAGASAGVKLIPIAALPSLAMQSPRPMRFLVTAAAVLVLPFIPFALAGEVMPGMRDYATRWIFNAPIFESIFALFRHLHAGDHLKDIWTAIKDPLRLEAISATVYEHLYDDFLARATAGLTAVVTISILARRRAPVSAAVGTLLVCAPAVHPWYWLVLLPLAWIERARLWIALAVAAPFSYLLYDSQPRWLVTLLCYGVPLLISATRASASATSVVEEPSEETHARTGHDTSRW